MDGFSHHRLNYYSGYTPSCSTRATATVWCTCRARRGIPVRAHLHAALSRQKQPQSPHLPATSYIHYTADLARACAGQAQAIFVTASFEAADIARDSDRILLTAVAARKYLIRYGCVVFIWDVGKCMPYVVVVDMH